MKIQEIYDKYKIMPQLQLHQLRVSGVASIICDHFQEIIDKEAIVSAALLHDLGNIIKFDLTLFPETVEPEGLEYWQSVKQDFVNKYGEDEHEATYKILEKIGVSKKIQEIVEAYGFSKGKKTSKINNYEFKIAAYSDHRVSANGVENLLDRFQEKKDRSSTKFVTYMDTIIPFWEKIEKQIFKNCTIEPEDITNEIIEPLLEQLRDYEIN